MGLDITVREVEEIHCPDCGRLVTTKDVDGVNSGGRAWYEFLGQIGYYVPYEQRTMSNDWYGKDMALDVQQVQYLLKFVAKCEPAQYKEIQQIVAHAIGKGNRVVINADW